MKVSLPTRIAVVVFLVCGTCSGQGLGPLRSEDRSAVKTREECTKMIARAIVDELIVNTSLETARRYGVESAGRVSIHLDVLVAPFILDAEGFSTHVIYLVPGYGYVIREVSVYPREDLALFWLGYSPSGPGTDTGFNCTHSHSNCKIEDLPFKDLRSAFRTWRLVATTVLIGDSDLSGKARERNARRTKLITAGG
ncbi:MAG TPA: hypothetical protein VLY24_07390 [Bryobacteraceae bacterium]|nr:hypothetical protein [Bryobacteraceae bacterium]